MTRVRAARSPRRGYLAESGPRKTGRGAGLEERKRTPAAAPVTPGRRGRRPRRSNCNFPARAPRVTCRGRPLPPRSRAGWRRGLRRHFRGRDRLGRPSARPQLQPPRQKRAGDGVRVTIPSGSGRGTRISRCLSAPLPLPAGSRPSPSREPVPPRRPRGRVYATAAGSEGRRGPQGSAARARSQPPPSAGTQRAPRPNAHLRRVGCRPAPAPTGGRGSVAAGRGRRGPAGRSGLASS